MNKSEPIKVVPLINITQISTTLPGDTANTIYSPPTGVVAVGSALTVSVGNPTRKRLFAQVLKSVGGDISCQPGTLRSGPTDNPWIADFTGLDDNQDDGTDQVLRVEAADDPTLSDQTLIDVEPTSVSLSSPPEPGGGTAPLKQNSVVTGVCGRNLLITGFVIQSSASSQVAIGIPGGGTGKVFSLTFNIPFTGNAVLELRSTRRGKPHPPRPQRTVRQINVNVTA
jgi:hypothetical protein